MKNKLLQELLLENGYAECIKVIETCENDKTVKEIQIDKKKGFTKLPELNKLIEKEIKTFGIKIKHIDMKKKLETFIDNTEKIEYNQNVIEKVPEPEKINCKNAIHTPFKSNISKEQKIKMFQDYKLSMFKIGKESWVTCPDCFNFEKIT